MLHIFAWDDYYPGGGIGDYVVSVASIDEAWQVVLALRSSQEVAIAGISHGGRFYDNVDVVAEVGGRLVSLLGQLEQQYGR